jgi:hypothetical protein
VRTQYRKGSIAQNAPAPTTADSVSASMEAVRSHSELAAGGLLGWRPDRCAASRWWYGGTGSRWSSGSEPRPQRWCRVAAGGMRCRNEPVEQLPGKAVIYRSTLLRSVFLKGW